MSRLSLILWDPMGSFLDDYFAFFSLCVFFPLRVPQLPEHVCF